MNDKNKVAPPIVIKNPPLDFELTELLGEKPGDFIVLYLDGQPVPFTGTPYDSPSQRESYQRFVESLNSRGKESRWPEFFANWKSYFCHHYKLPVETTSEQYHPTFSWAIHRVCAGYSEHPHLAITLFEKIGHRIRTWKLSKSNEGIEFAELVTLGGKEYRESGKGVAIALSAAAVRLLRDENKHSETEAPPAGGFKYTLAEAMADAEEWIAGATFNADSRGWLPAVALMREEILRLQKKFENEAPAWAELTDAVTAAALKRKELEARDAKLREAFAWLEKRGCTVELVSEDDEDFGILSSPGWQVSGYDIDEDGHEPDWITFSLGHKTMDDAIFDAVFGGGDAPAAKPAETTEGCAS